MHILLILAGAALMVTGLVGLSKKNKPGATTETAKQVTSTLAAAAPVLAAAVVSDEEKRAQEVASGKA